MAGALLALFIRVFLPLPIRIRSGIGMVVGYLFAFIPTRDREIASLQMKAFLPPKVKPPRLGKLYANFGQTAAEAVNLSPLLKDIRRYVDSEPTEYFESILPTKHATVFLAAHLSNWELLGAFLVYLGYDLSTAGREARHPHLQELLCEARDRYGIKTIWRSDSSASRDIIRAMKSGGTIAALIDQDTPVVSKIFPFFGHPAAVPDSVISLAQRYNANLATVSIVRTGFLKYRVFIQPLDASKSTAEILQEYHRRLEDLICKYPEQWVWIHKRWRTLNEGIRMSSNEYINYLKTLIKKKT